MATARDAALAKEFEAALQTAVDGDATGLWRLAATAGPASSATLWRLLAETGKDESRLQLLAALVAAGGTAEDERLLRWSEGAGRTPRDRAFVALLLAIGPARVGSADVYNRLRGASAFANAAAACAAARFADASRPLEAAAAADPGVAAAGVFAGAQRPRAAAAFRGDRHEALYWRGAFLGAARHGADATIRERAAAWREAPGDAQQEVRTAALWCAAIAGDLAAMTSRPERAGLEALAGDARTRSGHVAWYADAVGPREEHPERLAVAHAVTAPLAAVLAADAPWRADAAMARHVAVAVAWRLAGGESAAAELDAAAAWAPARLVVAANREPAAAVDDPQLAAAMRAYAGGRCDLATYALALETTLWRWGSHPALATWRLERAFVRDVLLAGSQLGGGRYQPHVPPDKRYLPEGIGRSDPWFRVAVTAFEALSPSRWPLPPGLRLAR